jgi:hypothetical protein
VGDQQVDGVGSQVRQCPFFVPEAEDGGLLAFATVGEVAVARDQAQQHTQFGRCPAGQTAPWLIAPRVRRPAQISQLDLAAAGVDLVPSGCLE